MPAHELHILGLSALLAHCIYMTASCIRANRQNTCNLRYFLIPTPIAVDYSQLYSHPPGPAL